uniref:GTP-binding protein TypA/BipA like protein n=1 Tax=Eufriesea mexicana TaxID=516756 RepID=A0A310SA77_9HYME
MSKFKNNGECITPEHGYSAEQNMINIAVIAHSDAVKSKLIYGLKKQSNIFRQNHVVVEQAMHSNDQERQRGITIYAKDCTVMHGNIKINITDTPGHTDFQSEVDRIMKTEGCVISLADSVEGLMTHSFRIAESYDGFISRIRIGRLFDSTFSEGQELIVFGDYDIERKAKIRYPFVYHRLKRVAVKNSATGVIACVAGIENITIGNTFCDTECVVPMEPITIQAPTMSMNYHVNNSPFCATGGNLETSNKIEGRLTEELETNVALKIEHLSGSNFDAFNVFRRIELHL